MVIVNFGPFWTQFWVRDFFVVNELSLVFPKLFFFFCVLSNCCHKKPVKWFFLLAAKKKFAWIIFNSAPGSDPLSIWTWHFWGSITAHKNVVFFFFEPYDNCLDFRENAWNYCFVISLSRKNKRDLLYCDISWRTWTRLDFSCYPHGNDYKWKFGDFILFSFSWWKKPKNVPPFFFRFCFRYGLGITNRNSKSY